MRHSASICYNTQFIWQLILGLYSLRRRRLNGYRDPHDKPETVWRPSQVYNGNPYTDKTEITFGFLTPATIPSFLFIYQHPNVFYSVTYHLTVYILVLSQQGHAFFIDRRTRVGGLCANVSENTTEIISGGNITQYAEWRIYISIYANNNIDITIYIECVVQSRLILFNLALCKFWPFSSSYV